MYVLNDVGAGDGEDVVVALEGAWVVFEGFATEVVFGEADFLNEATHGAVEEQDSFFEYGSDELETLIHVLRGCFMGTWVCRENTKKGVRGVRKSCCASHRQAGPCATEKHKIEKLKTSIWSRLQRLDRAR